MSPSAAVQRALQAANSSTPTTTATAANATATATANGTVERCASQVIGAAVFGLPEQLACINVSSYSFFTMSTAPTTDEMKRMCPSRACRTTIEALQRAAPSECQLPYGGTPSYLYRDVIFPVKRTCGFSGANDTSSAPLNSGGNDSLHAPIESSTGSGTSNLGVGSIFALIGGAIACGLLAAFVSMQIKRRRKDAAMMELAEPSRDLRSENFDSMVAPLGEGDDKYSPQTHEEFAALAMSSKASSNHSRASTAHSMGSSDHGDPLSMVPSSPMETAAKTIESAFDDPALVMLRVPTAKIQVGTLISQGGFNQVYSGTYDHQLPVAIKKLLPGKCEDVKQLHLFLGEAKLLGRLSHERIERLVGIAWEPSDKDPWLLTEYASGGDLRGFLDRYAVEQRLVGFSIEKVRIALHVAEALEYLHSQSPVVLHRTLKSRNVLLNSHLEAVVADICVRRKRDKHSSEGASLWTAPELLMGKRYDEKADIFSYGVLLSEIDTHDLPYANARDRNGRKPHVTELHRRISSGDLSVTFSERADPDMIALGRQCISLNPRDRPTARDLFQRVSHVMQSYVAFV